MEFCCYSRDLKFSSMVLWVLAGVVVQGWLCTEGGVGPRSVLAWFWVCFPVSYRTLVSAKWQVSGNTFYFCLVIWDLGCSRRVCSAFFPQLLLSSYCAWKVDLHLSVGICRVCGNLVYRTSSLGLCRQGLASVCHWRDMERMMRISVSEWDVFQANKKRKKSLSNAEHKHLSLLSVSFQQSYAQGESAGKRIIKAAIWEALHTSWYSWPPWWLMLIQFNSEEVQGQSFKEENRKKSGIFQIDT